MRLTPKARKYFKKITKKHPALAGELRRGLVSKSQRPALITKSAASIWPTPSYTGAPLVDVSDPAQREMLWKIRNGFGQ